ncbi:MAG: GHKL domain-containing protein, partial [Lachnospiraceae bacterium]|nr:GHKL domain-containing protein [Lachnospiraceae bacterium]
MEIASNLFESVLFVIFLTLFLKTKRDKRVFFCCAFTTAVLLFLNITCSDYFSSYSIVTVFLDFLITMLFWKCCLEGSFPQFFMGFGLYWFGISSSAYITVYIFSLIESEAVTAMFSLESAYRVEGILLTRVLIVLYISIVLYNRKKFRYYHNYALFTCYVIIPVIVMGIFAILTRTLIDLYYIEPEIAGQIIYIAICICAMFILVLILSINVSRKQEKEREVQRLNDMIEVQKQSLESYVSGERERHKQRHELEHKFYTIQYLLEQNRISEGMDVLRETIDGLYGNAKNMTISGNIIDTVLANKEKKYASNHIIFEKEIKVGSEETLDLVDLCILIGNLVENAMEAADKSEAKKVRITVKERFNSLCIFVSNTFSETDSDVRNLRSKKKEIWKHGFGIQSVKEIVNRYHGEFECYYEGEWFYAKVIINYQI